MPAQAVEQQSSPVQMQYKAVPKSSRLVVIHGKKTIVPVVPSKLEIYPVSKLDSILGNFYLHTVLYFEKSSQKAGLTWEMEMEEFNFSLAKVLNLFPVMCGRLKVLDNGNLGIKSNDAGIRLFEATCDITLNEWLGDQDKSVWQQMFPEVRISDYSVSPLLAVQYTKFRCGAAAIGLSWCHILADFMSMDMFLKLWGEAHRNFGEVSSRPSFSAEKPTDLQLPPFAIQNGADIKPSELETQIFHLSSKSVEKLMQESGAPETEALCALIWKSIVKAQQHGGSSSRLCLWMNTNSDKNRRYFGNSATAFKFVDATSTNLLDQSVKHVAKSLELGTKLQQNGVKTPASFFANNVLFCDWAANVHSYNTDFGFSVPIYVDSRATSLFGEGMVTIAPGCDGGRSKTVFVSLRQDAMKRLLQDNAFASATSKTASTTSGAPAA